MTDPAPANHRPPPRPAWVKISLLVAAVVVGGGILLLIFSGGEHRPGRHQPGGGHDGHTPPVQHAP